MKNIILFDGVCHLCGFGIGFIVKHDAKEVFSFATIESEMGQSLIKKYALEDMDTLILIENTQVYIYSDAVLYIAKGLTSWHRYLFVFRYFPKAFRDAIYKLIAKYRYFIFGKREECMRPSDEVFGRFI